MTRMLRTLSLAAVLALPLGRATSQPAYARLSPDQIARYLEMKNKANENQNNNPQAGEQAKANAQKVYDRAEKVLGN